MPSHAGRPPVTRPASTDAADAAALARGDRAAFDRLHARLGAGLHRLLTRRSSGRADVADDLSQQTWAAVWRSLTHGGYDPARAAPSTFVYAVANHVWLQHRRSASRTQAQAGGPVPASVAERTLAHAEAPGSTAGDRALEHAELLDALRTCLEFGEGPAGLSDQERVLAFEAMRGVSERELARRVGVAPSTLHERKVALYNKLRTCLARKGYTREIVEQMPLPPE